MKCKQEQICEFPYKVFDCESIPYLGLFITALIFDGACLGLSFSALLKMNSVVIFIFGSNCWITSRRLRLEGEVLSIDPRLWFAVFSPLVISVIFYLR